MIWWDYVFNFVTLGADFESQNWKHDLARLCFMLYNPSQWKFWEHFENFGKVCKNLNFFFGFFWRISNYNFQSRRQIMTAKGVYESRTHFYLSRFAGRVLIVKGFVAKYIITCTWLWREGLEIFCPNKNYILSHKSSVFYHTLYPNIFQFHH